MKSLKRGFTIIEILVVIVIIGVLATIVFVGLDRYQAATRDSVRASSVTVITEALEKYYDENGEYPSCPDITSPVATVTTDVLTGVDGTVLVTPLASSGETNSIKCQDLVSMGGADIFAYVGDGSSACTAGNSCLQYTLKYKEESSGTIKTIQSRRQADLATSGQIGANFNASVAAGASGLTRIDLSWNSIQNASSYTLQRALNSTFTSGLTSLSMTQSATSYAWTGLTAGTQYYFRIQAISSGSATAWSNTATATTAQLATPVITATANSGSQITVTWSAITYATAYSLQRATNSTFTENLVTTNPSGTSSVVTGLSTGVTYYFRLQASAPGDTSNWSSTDSATTFVPVASSVAIGWTTDSGSTNHSASCSIGSPEYSRATTYRTDGSKADAWSAWSAWTTNTTFGDFISGEGMFGKAKVRAVCVYNGVMSSPVESSSIERVKEIYNISAGTWYNRVTAPALIGVGGVCPSGSTNMYKWGEIYHGSAGKHGGGGWGQWGDFEITNGPPNWSSGDNLNTYRISRTICETPYRQRSLISAVRGSTLQNCCGYNALNDFNWFAYSSGYNYSVLR